MENPKPKESHKTDLEILHELAELHGTFVLFNEMGEEGPANKPTFKIEVQVGDLVGFGSGTTKKKARLHAAKDIVKALSQVPPPEGKTPYWCKHRIEPMDPVERKYFFHNKNPITALTEVLMIKKLPVAEFKVVSVQYEHGTDYKPMYCMEVRAGQLSCQVSAIHKKEAKAMAAEKMLEMMGFKEQLQMQNPQMQPYQSQLFQQHVYEEQAAQQREHQEAVKALRCLPTKEERQGEPRPEEIQGELRPEENQEEPRPEERQEEPRLEESQEEPRLEETQEEPMPEETQGEPMPEETQGEPRSEETQGEPRLEETQEEPMPEDTKGEPMPEQTQGEPMPEESQGEPRPEETQVEPRPKESQGIPMPEEIQGEPRQEDSQDELGPEESPEELIILESQEIPRSKQVIAEETVDSSPEKTEETQTVQKGAKAAHLIAAAMIKKLIGNALEVPDIKQQFRLVLMLRKVENGVRIPEDSNLTAKDLKAIGKAAAKSLLKECGSVFALSENDFTEETMKLNLNLQLTYFLAHRPQTKTTGFFSRVWKVFRRNKLSTGPLSRYLSSSIY